MTAQAKATEDTLRLARRVSADRQLGGRRDRSRGRRLRKAVAAMLAQLTPLSNTRHGREAMRDFAMAMRRCEMWGDSNTQISMPHASAIYGAMMIQTTLESCRASQFCP